MAFDAIRDENGDGKVDEGENTPVPGTISVWLNGYTTGKVSTSSTSTTYNECTARGEFTWNDTNEKDVVKSANTFKSKSAKGYKVGATTQTSFAADKYYNLGEAVAAEDFVGSGTYETTDAKFRIEIKTDETTGKTTYTFYRPDMETGYPLKLFGTGNAAYLRGKIGRMKKNDVYLVVTKGPYEGFLLTAYEVTYNDLDGKQQTSSSAPTVTLPASTRFTDYELHRELVDGKIRVVGPGGEETRYDRLSLALHAVESGSTIYLDGDIKVGFAAMLPDGVGNVTINGQGHTITRDTFVNPNTILTDPEISLMALEDEGEAGAIPQEHYTGAILQIGAGDTVTLQNVTIDGEGKCEIDQEKLEYDKELNKDYDINVLEDPKGGHPITELPGNVVSTDSLIKVAGGALILDKVTLENFFAGDGYDDDRHFIDFMSTEDGKLEVKSETVFQHNASRSGVCIGNTDKNEIDLSGCTTMEDNYCYGGNGGLVVAMEGTQVYMDEGTKIIDNVAADTNGIFIQLHKKTDGVKDGDNKGEIYAKLHMNGGEIGHNVGLRGGSYGWGQTIYLYNGGAFEMNGGEIHHNIGAGISSIYQQPSADALRLNKGWIHHNTCSLTDGDMALDIALMNQGNLGPDMIVEQNFVVGAAAILGGYASGDEYLTNYGVINGSISVYSCFNNEGRTTTVQNFGTIEGNLTLENGATVINEEDGIIRGNVKVRGALTESAGESSFHNDGDIFGNVELAENAHLYNGGEIYGDVTVKSGGTLTLNYEESSGHMEHGGTVHGDVTVYPDGMIRADVKPSYVDGTIYLEYEDEKDLERMQDVLKDAGIECDKVVPRQHEHSAALDETVIEPAADQKCTEPWTRVYTCQTCGKEVKRETFTFGEHDFYVAETDEPTCTTGAIQHIRCTRCSAYNSPREIKRNVPGQGPLGHDYVENRDLFVPPTEYASGHEYYICTRCGEVLDIEIPEVAHGAAKHSFQREDGSIDIDQGSVKAEANCTTDGEMTFICDGCKATITVAIPAKGHSYTDELVELTGEGDTSPSSCTQEGHYTLAPICSVCGEVDTASKITVHLPALGHVMSEWENVDTDTNYPCTAEREQMRHCTREDCDDYEGSIEVRFGGETNHTWDSDNVSCVACGYISNGHHISYMTNGGIAPESLADIAGVAYKPGDTQVLWQPSTDETLTGGWTKQTATGQAIFVGWSTSNLGAVPLETTPEATFIASVVIPQDSDAVVYAVWAADQNKNGTPDYQETPVTVFYDKNGGTGDVPAPLTGALPGAAYPLETKPALTKGADLFAGWSLTRQSEVIHETGSETIIRSLVASPFPVPAGVGDVTLYAVYATDANANGKPDYCEDALHVEYYINGGQVHDGYTVDENGMFYVCNDYHLPGENAALLALEYGGMMIYRDKAVLLGWSTEPYEEPLESEESVDGKLITTVNLAGTASNAKVYALWAVDRNSNSIADYLETALTHTYHQNQYLSQNDGSTLPLGYALDVTTPVPPHQIEILPGTGVALADNHYLGSADLKDGKGQVVGHYMQVGWSGYSHGACLSQENYDNWVIAGDVNGYTDEDGQYYRVIYDTRFQNAFAVWAPDEDGNGTPDFEEYYTITLDLNGGTAGAGFTASTTVKEGGSFTFPADPAKPGFTFQGWSADGGVTLYKAGDEVKATASVTYVALYNAITHTVTLDLNGGTAGDGFAASVTVQEGEPFSFPADPTKAGFTFQGWSADGGVTLYKAGDAVTVTADVTYTAQYEEVVAAPKTFTVTLDLNGGTAADGFTASVTVREGEPFPFPADPTKAGFTFQGWSADGGADLYKAGDTVAVTSDLLFTAQWTATGSSRSRRRRATVCDGGATCPSRPYTDVDQSKWYHLGVDYVIVNKLMLGRAAYIFDPDGVTTRGEMATILYRLEGSPAVTAAARFPDVPAGQWYSDAISWAAANVIFKGYGDGRFGPNDAITREQMAAILYRYASWKGYDVTDLADLAGYADAEAVSDWADTEMKWAVGAGVIEGTSATALSPSGDSTRAQIATILQRFCEDIAE